MRGPQVSTKRVVCVEATRTNGVLEIALQWQVRGTNDDGGAIDEDEATL